MLIVFIVVVSVQSKCESTYKRCAGEKLKNIGTPSHKLEHVIDFYERNIYFHIDCSRSIDADTKTYTSDEQSFLMNIFFFKANK